MKKLFVLPLLTLVLVLASSTSFEAQANPSHSSEAQAQQAKPAESFDTFSEKFYKDAAFQLSRVSFPVGTFYDFKQGKKVPYTKSNWQKLYRFKDMYTQKYPPFNKNNDGSYTYSQESDGGAVVTNYTFSLKEDGKWYLTKIH